MRSAAVVVGPPFIDDPAGVRQAPEEVLVQALVPESSVQALDEAVLLRLARSDVVPLDAAILLKRSIASDVSWVPLSLTISCGWPRLSMIRSSSRTTRCPESEVSAATSGAALQVDGGVVRFVA